MKTNYFIKFSNFPAAIFEEKIETYLKTIPKNENENIVKFFLKSKKE
jgi:hypothetical protein